MLKYFKIIILLLIFKPISAEYILYKVDAENKVQMLNAKEHKEAYQTMLKYQFPTNLCYQHETKLTKEQEELYKNSEEKFIQSLLPQNIKIRFVPTVIYELLFYKFYLYASLHSKVMCRDLTCYRDLDLSNKFKNIDKNNADYRSAYQKFCTEINFDMGTYFVINLYEYYLNKYSLFKSDRHDPTKWNYNNYLKAMAELNNDEDVIQLHLIANNKIALLPFLLRSKEHVIAIIPQLIAEINKTLNEIKEKHKVDFSNARSFSMSGYDLASLLPVNESDSDFFKNTAMTEYYAHNTGNYLIFRACPGNFLGIPIIDFTAKHRVSYGHSIFGGILHDIGACAYFHSSYKKHNVCYALQVNKFDYLNKKINCHEFFFIPPIHTPVTLSLHGELFHVSSKVKTLPQLGNHTIFGLAGPAEFSTGCLLTESNQSVDEYEESFQKYLNENVIFLVNKQGIQLRSRL